MVDPVSVGIGAAAFAAVEYVIVPLGQQVSDAISTNPPEQSNRGGQ